MSADGEEAMIVVDMVEHDGDDDLNGDDDPNGDDEPDGDGEPDDDSNPDRDGELEEKVHNERNSFVSSTAKVKMRKFGFMGSMSMLNQAIHRHNTLIPEVRARSKSAINLGKMLRKNSTSSLKVKDDSVIKDTNRDSGVIVDNHEILIDEKTLSELKERKRSKLNELLHTEERYFGDLIKISTIFSEMRKSKEDPDYPVQMPEEFQRIFSVFVGNFHEIRDFHKEMFTDTMRDSIWKADLMRDLFRKSQYAMKSIYGKYCRNWKKCEYILRKFDLFFKEIEEHMKSEGRVQDQLIKPIQTINRYHLFFTDLVKICEQLDKSEEHILYAECLFVTKGISKYVNDIMATGRIENFPECEDITNQGNLLQRGFAKYRIGNKVSSFGSYFFSKMMSEDTHEIPVHMFLFEKSFIVCYYKKNTQEFELGDEYRYWTMFKIKKMKIDTGESREMIITNTETGHSVTLVLDTEEEREEWVKRIRKEVKMIDIIVRKLMMQAVSVDHESSP